jgi:hypothetical protein
MRLRTFDRVTDEDLREIVRLSLEELTRFTAKAGNPPGKYAPYLERLIAVCLCQGAAQHYVDLQNAERFDSEVLVNADEIRDKGFRTLPTGQVASGVKDVDVVFFFEHYAPVPIPNVRHCRKSLYADLPTLGKRRIDFMKKTVLPEVVETAEARQPSAVVSAYVKLTRHGHYLGTKSVIGLYPDNIMGLAIWRSRRLTASSGIEPT